MWIIIIGGILTLVLFQKRLAEPQETLKPQQFWALFESNQIDEATVNPSPQSPIFDIVGKYHNIEKDGTKSAVVPFHAKLLLADSQIATLSHYTGIDVKEPNTMLLSVMMTLLPILLIGAFIWFFFIRQIKMAGKGALSFGKSKARLLAKERNKTTFQRRGRDSGSHRGSFRTG